MTRWIFVIQHSVVLDAWSHMHNPFLKLFKNFSIKCVNSILFLNNSFHCELLIKMHKIPNSGTIQSVLENTGLLLWWSSSICYLPSVNTVSSLKSKLLTKYYLRPTQYLFAQRCLKLMSLILEYTKKPSLRKYSYGQPKTLRNSNPYWWCTSVTRSNATLPALWLL